MPKRVVNGIFIQQADNGVPELLLVRKRDSNKLILPGGKNIPREKFVDTLKREIGEEELPGIVFTVGDRFTDVVDVSPTNKCDIRVSAYICKMLCGSDDFSVGAEISEFVWLRRFNLNRSILSGATRQILEALMSRGLFW